MDDNSEADAKRRWQEVQTLVNISVGLVALLGAIYAFLTVFLIPNPPWVTSISLTGVAGVGIWISIKRPEWLGKKMVPFYFGVLSLACVQAATIALMFHFVLMSLKESGPSIGITITPPLMQGLLLTVDSGVFAILTIQSVMNFLLNRLVSPPTLNVEQER